MALSLDGERSIAAASSANPIRVVLAFLARRAARLRQRRAVVEMLDLDAARLRDLGVTRADIAEALKAEKGRAPGMVLNAARARAARS